jgi:hypothetical protein
VASSSPCKQRKHTANHTSDTTATARSQGCCRSRTPKRYFGTTQPILRKSSGTGDELGHEGPEIGPRGGGKKPTHPVDCYICDSPTYLLDFFLNHFLYIFRRFSNWGAVEKEKKKRRRT